MEEPSNESFACPGDFETIEIDGEKWLKCKLCEYKSKLYYDITEE